MATIAEHNESMTLYYSKSTGVIRTIIKGIQDMSLYGEQAEDMSIIQSFIVVPYSRDIFDNKDNYKVNLGTLQVVKVLTTEEEERFSKLEEENVNLKLAMAEVIELVMGGGV